MLNTCNYDLSIILTINSSDITEHEFIDKPASLTIQCIKNYM